MSNPNRDFLRGNRMLPALLLSAWTLLWLAAGAQAAQVEEAYSFSTVAMPELMLGVGIRATAMGNAGAALSGDPAALYWNPAGLGQLRQTEMEFNHNSWIQGVSQEFIVFGMPLLGGAAAAGVNIWSLGEIEKTGMASDGQMFRDGSTLGLSMYDVNLGYGITLEGGWSLGLAAKCVLESLGAESLFAAAADAGVQYAVPESGLILGLDLENLGTSVKGWNLPAGVRVGASYSLADLRAEHGLCLAFDVQVPTAASAQIMGHMGAEYAYNRMFFARAGYVLSDVSSQGTGGGLTAGLGLVLGGWKLGYTFAPQGELGSSHRFALGMDFDAMGKSNPQEAQPVQKPARRGGYRSAAVEKRASPASRALTADEQAMRSLMQQSLTVRTEAERALFGTGALEAVGFHIQRASGPRIKSWRLILSAAGGWEVAALRGDGFTEVISWNLLGHNGKPAADPGALRYKLILSDVNGAEETAEGPILISQEPAPATAAPAAVAVNQTFNDIRFRENRSDLTPEASRRLYRAVEVMRSHPDAKILIEGFCDPVSEKDNAVMLSKARAEAVSRQLTTYYKISIARIILKARGAQKPLVKSGSAKQRARNRRVEITVKNNGE